MTKTVQVPMQTRVASVAPSSIDAEKRTVELVWSTGAAVKRMDFWTGETFIEKLSMEPSAIRMGRLNGGAPLLNTHSRYELSDMIGVVEKAWVADGEGRAIVRFSSREDVAPIWQDVQDGIIRNVSVGYSVHKFEDVTEKGEKVRTFLATDWEPSEISLVPIGADAQAGIRSQDGKQDCEIICPEDHPVQETRDSEDNSVTRDADSGPAAPPETDEGVRQYHEAELRLALA